MDRQGELERDEQWKVEHCRSCPKCRRLVEKIDGCNTLVCGQDTHGGNRQPGCGHRFNWQTAKAYKAQARAPRLPPTNAIAAAGAISGRWVRHLFTKCGLCGSGKCIVGPRFRCIHCLSFSCCLKCERRLASEHEEGHVFQIMFEDDLDWRNYDVVLPKGTRARLRRLSCRSDAAEAAGASVASVGADGRKRRRGGRDDAAGLEGVVIGQKRGKYVVDLARGLGERLVAVEDLQPLLTQRQADRILSVIPAPKAAHAAAI